VINEHEYAQKWHNVIQWEAYGEISLHFLMKKYLQRPIYVWNKTSKHNVLM
jgi:hypothetical protein